VKIYESKKYPFFGEGDQLGEKGEERDVGKNKSILTLKIIL
jgi:hypothetical protein